MRAPALRGSDHAFAYCPAFLRVTSVQDARTTLQAQVQLVSEADAETLAGVWRMFDASARVAADVRLGLNARLINPGPAEQVEIAHHAVVRGVLNVEPEGRLVLAPFSYVGDGVIVSAAASVDIGEGALLAHGVMVFDNDTHPINPHAREVHFRRMVGVKDRSARIEIRSAPVRIGRRCWIGMNAMVMKGVVIGDDTMVAAGSVVVDSLPAGVLAAGNPARVVRPLTAEELAAPGAVDA